MKRLKGALQLASSMAKINNIVAEEAHEAKKALEDEFRNKAPGAISKLIKQTQSSVVNSDQQCFDNLTVAEMQAICVIYFLKPKPTGLKAAVVKQVEAYHREHPHVLGDAVQRTLLAAQQAQVEVINRPPSIQAPTCSVIT